MSRETVLESFSTNGKFDRKHIANLSDKKVPTALLKQVEQGCSIETLEQLAAGYPICKYKTQITVHGLFDEPKSGYVGGYKNLVRNQNGSLGIKWSAIDAAKRHGLAKVARLYGWRYSESSSESYLYKMETASDKVTAMSIYEQMKEAAAKIDTSLFCGFVDVYCYTLYGTYYIALKVFVLCFYESNTKAILDNLTGSTESERATAMEQAERAAAEQRAKREQERATAQAEQERKSAERATALAEWAKANPLPAAFVEQSNYTLKSGDIYCIGARELQDGTFGYVYYRVTTAFGNLIKTRCNEQGEKIAGTKGDRLNNPTRERVLVRAESHGTAAKATESKPATKPAKTQAETKPAKATESKPATKPAKTKVNGNITIVDYSDKALVVIGNSYQYMAQFKTMGAVWNSHLSCGAGWVFSKKRVSEADLKAVICG